MTDTNNSGDDIAARLNELEDEILQFIDRRVPPSRWRSTGITDIEKGFMCARRAVYDGRRVLDDATKT